MAETNYSLVRKLLSYDPKTGILRWRISQGARAQAGSVAGCTKSTGQVVIRVNKRLYLAHRVIWLWMTGGWPKHQIDHIDGNPRNNCWNNLRDVPHRQNQKNMARRSDNKSGIPGVFWDKTRCLWHVYIKVHGKNKSLGRFADFFEAACARKSAELMFGYHANHGKRNSRYRS